MWMDSRVAHDTSQQSCKPCCEFCNAEIPDIVAGHFRCVHCTTNYCSKEHKKADFRFHKQRCRNFPVDTLQTNDTSLSDSLSPANAPQYVQQFGNAESLQSPYQELNSARFTQGSLNPLGVQDACQVDTRVSTTTSLQHSPTIAAASSSRLQVSPKGQQLNYQYYQASQSQAHSFQTQLQLSPVQINDVQNTSPTGVQTVTVQNAPIEIQNANPVSNDDQIPLDDVLESFLQDAEQYDSRAEDSKQPATLPRNLLGILRDLTKQREEQLFYDELLSLEPSTNTVSAKRLPSSQPNTCNKDTDETVLQSTVGLSSQVGTSEQITAKIIEHFEDHHSSGIAGTPTLEEEGIFPRYNLNEVAECIVKSLDIHNYCIIDNLHGVAMATAILEEVQQFHEEKAFSEGRLSTSDVKHGTANKAVREDLVAWTDGKGRKAIRKHMGRVDFLMKLCNRFITECQISSRTQAMAACYPGKGSGYKQHIDNPNKDGRCITTLYYLNPNWNIETDGGLLRLFPNGIVRKTVNIEPIFDRLLFFWSDRRTPHEVTPAFKIRYAITLWYFNDEERKKYFQRTYSTDFLKYIFGFPVSYTRSLCSIVLRVVNRHR
ncbi:hypothetical protein QZH41_015539 [Actinostola sp. cb2023]|nr:hypothetical protein QZH41_015539 [Actinostola sp. cb2023]